MHRMGIKDDAFSLHSLSVVLRQNPQSIVVCSVPLGRETHSKAKVG